MPTRHGKSTGALTVLPPPGGALDARRNNDARAFALSSISIVVGTSRWPKNIARCSSMIIIPRSMPASACGSPRLIIPPLHLMDEPSLYDGIDPGHRLFITMRADAWFENGDLSGRKAPQAPRSRALLPSEQ